MDTKSDCWAPILSGTDAEAALSLVDTIAREMPDGTQAASSGCVGISLFHAYRAVALQDDAAGAAALSLLEDAIESTFAEGRNVSLFGGITGVAFVLTHLAGALVDLGDDDPADELDCVLLELLAARPWTLPYDLISGLVGIGVYALERLPRSVAAACLERIVERLDELSECLPDGIAWWTPVEHLPPSQAINFARGYYNLGVAHGIPGIIALLARIHGAGVAQTRARILLDGAVHWLLNQRLPEGDSSFPAFIAPNIPPKPTRSAWCYGDPGVAGALMAAARCVGEPEWEGEALALARQAAARPIEATGVIDAGLCHGAASLGHVFNRLHQATGDTVLRDTALYWYRQVLEYRQQGEAGWPAEPDFLDGVSGVGLALLAAATPLEPAWDRLLQLS